MGEIQIVGRIFRVMGMILIVRVRLAVWVGEMQLGKRTGGVMGTISVVRVTAENMGG